MNLDEAVKCSEIAKNIGEAAALLGGVWTIWAWLRQRKDRAADVLLMLETRFAVPDVVKGRAALEDQATYDDIRPALEAAALARAGGPALEPAVADRLYSVDALLRFYVVLLGIRHAHQVPDLSLRTCYRYWLGLYFASERKDFRRYVDAYYTTLSQWLNSDMQRQPKKRFFDAI